MGLAIDTISIGLGVRVLTMTGSPHSAFHLLEQVYATRESWKIEGQTGEYRKRRRGRSVPAEVNLFALHQFMTALHRMGRPDVVFALWDHMTSLYGLHPDVFTINILLQTAKWARKFEDTIKGQLASLDFGRTAIDIIPTAFPADERARLATHISTLLDHARQPWITGAWNDQRGARAALRVAVCMFLGNWPELRHVASPVRALRRSGAEGTAQPLRDAFNSVMERAPYDESPLYRLAPPPSSPLYPRIVPTDVTFRAFIELLAAESLATEIPLALAWMRALRVHPSKVTLATALVHWMDVSMDAPLIERFKGNQGRNPYVALTQWLEGWVGKGGMPVREDMAKEMKRAAYYRDVNWPQVVQERARRAEYD